MFSRRSAWPMETNALSRALDAARASGAPVLDLTVSNPTRAELPYDAASIVAAFADPRMLDYAPLPFGLTSAREAVAEDFAAHGHAVDPSRVVLTASTSEAYSFLFKLLCDPGDEVLVPQPSYPLFDHLAAFESVTLVPYSVAYDGAWHVDVDSVRAAVGPRSRAILLVSPNNPTGSYVKKDELTALAALGLPLVSDEVFARYALTHDAARPWSALEAEGALVFAMSGLSKLAALPQMKAAWTVVGGPPPLVATALARLELIADSFLSVGTPVQNALPKLLASRHAAEQAVVRRTRANLSCLRASIGKDSAASLLHVEGGWYATLRVPRTASEEAWVLELLARDRVHVHPGHFFDFREEAHLIVSLLTPEATFTEGCRRILARVAAHVAA